MKRPTYRVYKTGPGSGGPSFTGSLSACLDFIRHYMKGGSDGFTICSGDK